MSANLPAVDDHVVEPESGTEMIHGEIRKVMPAEPPHAMEQARIAAVISSSVAPGYEAATELLTRVNAANNFATDACIYKLGRDPETGSRYLEELSFEVKHKQSLRDITDRARMLVDRGVRRVFAVHVREDEHGNIKAGPVREWKYAHGEWNWLDMHPEDSIRDHCLLHPIKVQALIDAAEADNHLARVLLAKNNPVIATAVETREKELKEALDRELQARDAEHQRAMQARDERDKETLRKMILRLCGVLAIEVTAERRARMASMSTDELDTLCSAVSEQRRWPERR